MSVMCVCLCAYVYGVRMSTCAYVYGVRMSMVCVCLWCAYVYVVRMSMACVYLWCAYVCGVCVWLFLLLCVYRILLAKVARKCILHIHAVSREKTYLTIPYFSTGNVDLSRFADFMGPASVFVCVW